MTEYKIHEEVPQLTEIEDDSQLTLTFGFEVPLIRLTDLFQQVAIHFKFQMIEREAAHATAIRQNKKSLLQILDCFSWVSDSSVTAIKLSIRTNEMNSTRVCTLRGLVGDRREVLQFLNRYKHLSQSLEKQENQYHPIESVLSESLENPFHLEACAAYMFHKILSNENYGVGSTLSRSIRAFCERYKNAEASSPLLPEPMRSAVAIVKETVDNLYKDFNSARKEMGRIMPYCRISVERYVFERVGATLKPIYHFKLRNNTQQFLQKREQLFKCYSVAKLFEEIELKKPYWLLQNPISEEDLEKPMSRLQLRSLSKYRKAYEEMEKVGFVCNIREKIKHWQISYSLLKTAVYEASGGKQELGSMESILPVLILSVLLSDLPELPAELQTAVNFIEAEESDFEEEKRVLLNFTHAWEYIARDLK